MWFLECIGVMHSYMLIILDLQKDQKRPRLARRNLQKFAKPEKTAWQLGVLRITRNTKKKQENTTYCQKSSLKSFMFINKLPGFGSKKGTQKTLLAKGKIDPESGIFLTHSHIHAKPGFSENKKHSPRSKPTPTSHSH